MIGSRYQIKPVLGGHDRFKTTQTSGGWPANHLETKIWFINQTFGLSHLFITIYSITEDGKRIVAFRTRMSFFFRLRYNVKFEVKKVYT